MAGVGSTLGVFMMFSRAGGSSPEDCGTLTPLFFSAMPPGWAGLPSSFGLTGSSISLTCTPADDSSPVPGALSEADTVPSSSRGEAKESAIFRRCFFFFFFSPPVSSSPVMSVADATRPVLFDDFLSSLLKLFSFFLFFFFSPFDAVVEEYDPLLPLTHSALTFGLTFMAGSLFFRDKLLALPPPPKSGKSPRWLFFSRIVLNLISCAFSRRI
mmetsp:Transcript_19446/g.54632  ORF Transcript_19446/g.54632 Transcript_19446/m.54632 type:complete len:213 (+) Transcript_19446:3055-3693(+)